MLTGMTTLTFEDVLKALRDNERMTGNDSSYEWMCVLLLMTLEGGRNFLKARIVRKWVLRSKSRMGGDHEYSKGKKKVDGGEMNVVDNGGDEFLMTERTRHCGI
ncbi:hypothetical protein Tco_0290945 [Tanacetum coccineum]